LSHGLSEAWLSIEIPTNVPTCGRGKTPGTQVFVSQGCLVYSLYLYLYLYLYLSWPPNYLQTVRPL
jgi:hypothetical protein